MFVSYMDRSILALLVQPIKASLGLSDVQMGLLHGVTFALVFTITMLPIGWLADNVSRTKLLGSAVAFWSLMTAACGLPTNFAQMFALRMGVAIGEATVSPTAPSLIADYFPPERRTPPLSLYGMGGGIGIAASLLIGGLIARFLGGSDTVAVPGIGTVNTWQVIFFGVGSPGVLLSLLLFLQREPPRRDQDQANGTFQEMLLVILSRRWIIFPHMAAFCLFYIAGYSMNSWLPAFFMRVHGWSLADVGIRMGTVLLVSGILGAFLGGFVARAFWRRGRRDANFLTAALFLTLIVVPAVSATTTTNAPASALLVGVMNLFLLAPGGPLLGAIQEIIPNRLRGRVTALYYVALGFVAMAIGPLVIGILNDYVFADPRSVGKSLALTAAVTLPPASALMLFAGRQRAKLDWTG
jgi:MFS family permease